MRTVVLVGTDHKFQIPVDSSHSAGIESFRNTVRKLFHMHQLCAIAEEMSLEALAKYKTESVAQQLCIELGDRPHNYSDPDTDERIALGILEATEDAKRIREREWLRRIQEFNYWPLLFICGAEHFTHFAKLLRDSEIGVIEAYQDWGPIIEVTKPTPLYSDDSYPEYSNFHPCLKHLRRTIAKHLLPNERVVVKESVCGNDYWALRVETDSGSMGWILDVDEGISISYPAI